MDESGSVDGTELGEEGLARWSAAGAVLAARSPTLYWYLLQLAEATVSELSTVGNEKTS